MFVEPEMQKALTPEQMAVSAANVGLVRPTGRPRYFQSHLVGGLPVTVVAVETVLGRSRVAVAQSTRAHVDQTFAVIYGKRDRVVSQPGIGGNEDQKRGLWFGLGTPHDKRSVVAHGLALQLEIKPPGVDIRLGIGRNTKAVIHLPSGIVDFVGGQTEPVSAFLILGRIVFKSCRLIAEALKLGPPIIQVPRLMIRASRPNSLASATWTPRSSPKTSMQANDRSQEHSIRDQQNASLLAPRSKPGRRWRTWQRPRYRSSRPFLPAHKRSRCAKRSCRFFFPAGHQTGLTGKGSFNPMPPLSHRGRSASLPFRPNCRSGDAIGEP